MSPTPTPTLPIAGNDPRATAYGNIARFHANLLGIKRKAEITGIPLHITLENLAALALHCEASIAFLAEELLKLGKLVESGPEIET